MTVDTSIDEQLDHVRGQWVEHSLYGAPIRDETVFEIAWLLISNGVQPTQENVRRINGGGSPNVIHPSLRRFFAGELATRWKRPVADTSLPKPLMKLWDAAMSEATRAADSQMATARATLDDATAALEAREAAAQQLLQDAESRAARDQVTIGLLTQQLDDLKGELASQKQEAAAERDKLNDARERAQDDANQTKVKLSIAELALQASQTDVEALRKDLRDKEVDTVALLGERGRLASELERAKAAEASSLERLSAAVTGMETLQRQFDVHRQQTGDTAKLAQNRIELMEAATVALQSELAAAKAEVAAQTRAAGQIANARDWANEQAAIARKAETDAIRAIARVEGELEATRRLLDQGIENSKAKRTLKPSKDAPKDASKKRGEE